MKSTLVKLFSGIFIVVIAGCSPVKFYSNTGLTHKSGLKYYTLKPYLQVERDLASNSIVKTTILYLPDLENPQYIAMKDGLGSRKVDLKLSDGAISSLGTESDPDIAATITALGNLVSKTTSAVSDIAALRGVPGATASTTVIELYDIIMSGGLTSVKRIEIK